MEGGAGAGGHIRTSSEEEAGGVAGMDIRGGAEAVGGDDSIQARIHTAGKGVEDHCTFLSCVVAWS